MSILAYGQTGSGKSYTMGTSDPGSWNQDSTGLIQRTAHNLFQELVSITSSPQQPPSTLVRTSSLGSSMPKADANRKLATLSPRASSCRTSRHYRHHSSTSAVLSALAPPPPTTHPWAVTVSYVEIYNEQLRDLLNTGPPQAAPNLCILEDVKGNISVSGLSEVVIETADQLVRLLERGSALRESNSNSLSSQSHAIFTIKLTQKQKKPETGIISTVTSKLNFVDLAGSERLDNNNIGYQKEEGTESGHSNSGLLSLSRVLSQLSMQPLVGHVSYKDSKLTRLLQDSLDERAVTHFIACILKEPHQVSETLDTLTYAHRTRVPQVTTEPQLSVISKEAELKATIEQLQNELKSYKLKTATTNPNFLPTSPSHSLPSSPRLSFVMPSLIQNHLDLSLVENTVEASEYNSNVEASRKRVDRSQEFHKAVEKVIEDYEKTIASLQASLLELRIHSKETQTRLDDRTLELEECQASYLEVVEMAERMEERLNVVLREQRGERQMFEDQLRYAMSTNNSATTTTSANANSSFPPQVMSSSPTNSDVESRKSRVSSSSSTSPITTDPSIALDAEVYVLREQLKTCQLELKGLRVEHKSHSAESQFLTARYNQARRDADSLKTENQALRDQLALLQAASTTAPLVQEKINEDE